MAIENVTASNRCTKARSALLTPRFEASPLLGWGFLTAWGLVGMLLGSPDGGAELPQLPHMQLAVNASAVLALAIVIVASRFTRPLLARVMAHRYTRIIATLLMVGGCTINMLDRVYGTTTVLQYTTQAAASVGYVILAVLWCSTYSTHDPQEIEKFTVESTGLCALVFLIAIVGPAVLTAAIWLVLPAASAWCLSQCTCSAATETLHESHASWGISRVHLLCGLGVLVASSVLTLPATTLALGMLHDLPIDAGYAQLSGVVIAVVLVIWCTVYANRISLPAFFKVIYPLAVLGLLAIGAGEGMTRFVGLCLLYAAQWVLYVFIWLYATECPCTLGTPIAVYALVRLAFEAGYSVSGACSSMLSSNSIPPSTWAFSAAAILVLTILLPLDRDRDRETDVTAQASRDDAALSNEAALGRAESMAARFALSERESQVLGYLLHGYSLPAIRNELFISKGTVDTYVQRIYRKCGVHSRQELVDLADERVG